MAVYAKRYISASRSYFLYFSFFGYNNGIVKRTTCFLRHAEPDESFEDRLRPLTNKGEDQAKAFSPGLQFDLVISSPAVRAYETARLAGGGQSVQIIEDLYFLEAGHLMAPWLALWGTGKPLPGFDFASSLCGQIEQMADGATNLLVVAHNTVINIVGAVFSPKNAKLLLARNFGHAKGFILKPDDRVVFC